MKNFSISEINRLYTCASHCKIYTHEIYQETFRMFCQSIRSLEKDLGEQVHDEYWQGLFRELKTFRFTLYATPVPINFQAMHLFQALEQKKKYCQLFFPTFLHRLQEVVDSVLTLTNISDNPLLAKISELVQTEKVAKIALLLKEARFSPTTEEILNDHPEFQHVEVVNKYQLRGAHCYEKIFAIGPHYWFPEYIFNAPRADEIHYIRYSWILDNWSIKPLFIQAPTSPGNFNRGIPLIKKDMDIPAIDNDELESLNQEDIPEINWPKISTKIMRHTSNDRLQETAPAKLFLLAHNYAVFLDASENAKVLALDLETDAGEDEEGETQQVRRELVTRLQPGMFLLLRTGGSGDYIVSIANAKLGNDAVGYRQKQEHWKNLLRREAEARGLSPVCSELREKGGSVHVNEINLRHWLSSRNIRPRNDQDFSAILQLVGLQDEEERYLLTANKIKTAHQSAGMYIRNRLIKQVAMTNLHEIHKKGYLEIELPQFDEVSLTAFRIEYIESKITEVSYSHIGRLVTIKDD